MPNNIPLWVNLVGNFGFPIVITFYLFIRFEKKIEKIESVMFELTSVIKDLKHKKSKK